MHHLLHVLGVILGFMDELCYQQDAARIGGTYGGALGILSLITGMGTLHGVVFGAMWGAFAGIIISYVEKKWYRKQYAEW